MLFYVIMPSYHPCSNSVAAVAAVAVVVDAAYFVEAGTALPAALMVVSVSN